MKYTKKKVFLRRKRYNTTKKQYANKRKNKTMKGGEIKVVTNKNNNIRKLCIQDESGLINPENCWYLFPKNPKWTDANGNLIDPKKMNLGGLFGSLDSEWKKVISTLDKVAPNRPTTFDNKGFKNIVSPGEAVPVPTITNPEKETSLIEETAL